MMTEQEVTTPILTEEQILQMPESDYMNDAQLAFFRARLRQMEADIRNNAGETTEHLRETVIVPDPADRATIEEEHALELRTRDRERKLLKKIEQALATIDSGDYGYCEETGDPIGIPRLLARPTATLSLEAQQRGRTGMGACLAGLAQVGGRLAEEPMASPAGRVVHQMPHRADPSACGCLVCRKKTSVMSAVGHRAQKMGRKPLFCFHRKATKGAHVSPGGGLVPGPAGLLLAGYYRPTGGAWTRWPKSRPVLH